MQQTGVLDAHRIVEVSSSPILPRRELWMTFSCYAFVHSRAPKWEIPPLHAAFFVDPISILRNPNYRMLTHREIGSSGFQLAGQSVTMCDQALKFQAQGKDEFATA